MTILVVIGCGLLIAATIGMWVRLGRWERRLQRHEKCLDDWSAELWSRTTRASTDEPVRLSELPARTQLTDLECSLIMGTSLAVLLQMGEPDEVRRRLRWWTEYEQGWAILLEYAEEIRRLAGAPPFRQPAKSSADSGGAAPAGHVQ